MEGWKEKVDAAYDMVHALCQPRGSEGSREWIMSIPARPDYDPDLVITSGLRSAAKEIHALTAERDELQRRLAAVVMEHIRTAELKCYCEFDRDHERTMECEYCEEVAALRAIAEGRDNG